MNVARFLEKSALSFGDRPALTVGTTRVRDYRELAKAAAGLAGGLLHGLGLRPGDRVALAMKNCPEFMEVLNAAWHAGLCAVPINAKLHQREFAFILENSGARVCFVTADLAETIAPLCDEILGLDRVVSSDEPEYTALLRADQISVAEVAPTDPAWLFYTSGTTGRPKGATLSHRNLVSMTMNYFADMDTVSPRDCMIHAAPMSHGAGLFGLPQLAKAANQVVPESHGFDPAEMLGLIGEHPGAAMFFAPTMLVRLINHPDTAGADLANLKTIFYGGGPMYVADTVRALEVFGPRLVQLYGQGEAPMTITYLSKDMHADRGHPRYLERLGSVGIARTDVDVRVLGEDGRPASVGEVGEVCARGDVVMPGYWENPTATAETLRGGWLHTGDVGAFDGDGFLTLRDRSKDLIISGGTNIYPREIEEVLLRHPGVLEVSVVGRKHPDWGEEVVAFVVARPGEAVVESALDQLCLAEIARFKRPKEYRFVEALPKNNYGKVLKTDLRSQLETDGKPAA